MRYKLDILDLHKTPPSPDRILSATNRFFSSRLSFRQDGQVDVAMATSPSDKTVFARDNSFWERTILRKSSIRRMNSQSAVIWILVFVLAILLSTIAINRVVLAAEETGSIGIEGKISAPPPATGATISLPRDGQAFTTLPITVSGICPNDLLVKIFKNNVFAGSQMCAGGSFSISIDLFTGTDELVARVYDALDQAGPDSNKVTVTFNDNRQGAGSRVTLTTNYAKRGANPGDTLSWPIILSGGIVPYAISVDWGDGKPLDLKSLLVPGTFNIEHVYDSPGVYNLIVKATDKNGESAFLQLVAIANGALSQDTTSGTQKKDSSTIGTPKTRIVWQPAALSIPLILTTFWLGKRYELRMLRKRIERGQRPF